MDTYKEIKNVLAATMAEDLEWLSHGRVPGQKPDPVKNPWMPFQMADFVAIMTECVAESEGSRFLDVGSGIGTKLAVAETLFGLQPTGIEIDPVMVDHANSNGRRTLTCDVLEFRGYQDYDVIWMYRPFKDMLSQVKLEHKIHDAMKPGAILAGAHLSTVPNGFEIIIDDWETGCRGAWKKPIDWEPVIYDIDMDDE